MKPVKIALIMLAAGAISSSAVYGEGYVGGTPTDAGGGPYRRVQTLPIGYKAVQAHFTVPTIFIPTSHPSGSSPEFYIGGGSTNGGVEIDAGVNYEPGIKDGFPPGWTPTIRVTHGPHAGGASANGWRSNSTLNPNVTGYDLMWVVNPDNTAYLNVNANGADNQPLGTGRMNASGRAPIFWNQTGIFVKRVIAVGQNPWQGKDAHGNTITIPLSFGSYDEDGTYMRGCTTSNAQVATTTSPVINWQNWSTILNNMDQAETGFAPDGKDKHIGHTGRNAPGALYIVNYPGYPAEPQRSAILASRYDAETVDINLEKRIQPAGSVIVPHPRQHAR